MEASENKDNISYSLHALVLDENPNLEISETYFNNLKQAKKSLDLALVLEESYELVIKNYRELEVELLSSAVNNMTTRLSKYDDAYEIRTAIGRRLVNLLTANRMYVDKYSSNLKQIGVDSDQVNQTRNRIYDENFGYRFMEAYRNHVQHEGIAIYGIKMDSHWHEEDQSNKLQFSVSPYALKTSLKGSKFKASVLEECPEKIDLMRAVRVHVGGISSIHNEIRKLINPVVDNSRNLLSGAISRHENEARKQIVGLSAIAKRGDEIIDKVSIFLDWDDVREVLVRRNSSVSNLDKRFVTSQAE